MGELERFSTAKLPERFGKYTLLGHLATGGMAEVYLARQSGLQGFEKTVVIKRVRPELLTDREIIEAFLDEARLVATLQHPNIAQVYEIGLVNQSYFIVMEYVHGGDLRQLMERAVKARRKISVGDAIYLLIQACIALHYAHDKRGPDGARLDIIHRDVTPSNVLLSYDGAVKVCDFGIAKATTRTTETERGTLKGKYAYMSPEQCQSLALDRRSDIFTLGILLYELSTLTRPFEARSDFELLRAIIEHPIAPPSSRVRGYPPDLERIVMRALAKAPADRYPTAQAMQLDLEELAREHKLAMSSVNVARLVSELFERGSRGSDPAAKVLPRPDARPSAGDRGDPSDAIPVLSLVGDSAAVTTALVVPPLDEPEPPRATPAAGRPASNSTRPTLPMGAPAPPHRRTDPQFGGRQLQRADTPPAVHFDGEPEPCDTIPEPASPEPASPEPVAPPPPAPPRARPSLAWGIGALVAGLVAGGVTLAGRLIDDAAAATASAALDVDAERLAAPLDAGLRSARLRAGAIASTPVLHAAIETDAATMKDLAEREFVFSAVKNESLEVFQLRRGRQVSMIRLPAGSPPLAPLTGVTSRLEASGHTILVLTGAPVSGNSDAIAGEIVLATQIDLAAPTRQLAQHVAQAWLRGPGIDLQLVGEPGGVTGATRTFPLPTASELGALSLVAVPLMTAGTWVVPAQRASLGAAVLLLAIYLAGTLRSRRGR